MRNETVLTNARIVTRDDCILGSLKIVDGVIDDVSCGTSTLTQALDLDGDYLIPGLIDIHTDNLEKHVEPRPGVYWPFAAALSTHDQQLFSAGITTVFDSLSVGDYHDSGVKTGRHGTLQKAVSVLEEAKQAGLLQADHYLHIRCEICTENVVDSFMEFAADPFVKLVSIMDHTPGQRQWSNMEKWRKFNIKRFGNDDTAAMNFFAHRQEMQSLYSEPHRRAIIEQCRQRNLPMASHDDTTAEHVDEAAREGISISEFPTTFEAARSAHDKGMKNILGAPNVVQGGSHSGNVSAGLLAQENLVDGLASDYVPISLLHGAFILAQKTDMSLPQSIATVTSGPADMTGFSDRGEIVPGKRADLVRVKEWHHMPMIRGLWRRAD